MGSIKGTSKHTCISLFFSTPKNNNNNAHTQEKTNKNSRLRSSVHLNLVTRYILAASENSKQLGHERGQGELYLSSLTTSKSL
jgi:hypothetical protein